jgi:hypothetical protein
LAALDWRQCSNRLGQISVRIEQRATMSATHVLLDQQSQKVRLPGSRLA